MLYKHQLYGDMEISPIVEYGAWIFNEEMLIIW